MEEMEEHNVLEMAALTLEDLVVAHKVKACPCTSPNWSDIVMKRYKLKEMEEHTFLSVCHPSFIFRYVLTLRVNIAS